MAHSTAWLVPAFSRRVSEAQDLVRLVETARGFSPLRKIYVVEAAFLLVFTAWENFLEQSLLRLMCGHHNTVGTYARTGGATHCPTLGVAESVLLSGAPYLLWHDPQRVINRCNAQLVAGPHATVLASALPLMQSYAAIRHHVAHRTQDTRQKFDAACLALIGSRVRGGRAGRFLRITTTLAPSGVVTNWMGRVCADLESFAGQIAS
jgi:hypothetical protein